MTSASSARPAATRGTSSFQLRGGTFTLLVLRLDDPKDPALFQALRDKVMQAPNFFRNAPVVIDLQNLAEAAPFNMAELGRRLRQHQLLPIGVMHGTDEQNAAAINAGWSLFPAGREATTRESQAPSAAPPPPAATAIAADMNAAADAAADIDAADAAVARSAALADEPVASGPSRLITQPVRSGKQVYAAGGDLVILASIGAGAELLADGNIHVYGALRGRALAGVSGDRNARIFCRQLEAELVSIAGVWQVRDDIPEGLIGKPVQIHLDGDRLAIEPLP